MRCSNTTMMRTHQRNQMCITQAVCMMMTENVTVLPLTPSQCVQLKFSMKCFHGGQKLQQIGLFCGMKMKKRQCNQQLETKCTKHFCKHVFELRGHVETTKAFETARSHSIVVTAICWVHNKGVLSGANGPMTFDCVFATRSMTHWGEID